MTRTYVLDANAVLDFVEAGPGSRKVEQLLQSVLQKQSVVLISAINWGEVFYLLWQRRGEEKARTTIAGLSQLPVQIVDVDLLQALQAGEIKVFHKLPYVDCIAAALTMLNRAVLVTSDRDFEKLDRRIEISWIKRP